MTMLSFLYKKSIYKAMIMIITECEKSGCAYREMLAAITCMKQCWLKDKVEVGDIYRLIENCPSMTKNTLKPVLIRMQKGKELAYSYGFFCNEIVKKSADIQNQAEKNDWITY